MYNIAYVYMLAFLVIELIIVGIWFEKVWHNRTSILSVLLKTIPLVIAFFLVYNFSLRFDAVCILNLFFAPSIGACIYICKYNFV